MIIGDKSRFAVEFILDEVALATPGLGEWLYGSACFWVAGKCVGEPQYQTTLRDVVLEASWALEQEGLRGDEELSAMSANDAMARILRGLGGTDEEDSDEEIAADERRFRPLVVGPRVDVFDPWLIILVERGSSDLLVWQHQDEQVVHSVELRPREFGDVLRQFIAELQKQAGPYAVNLR